MIIKKNYGEDYIIMKVTNIETNEELSLHLNNDVEVIEV